VEGKARVTRRMRRGRKGEWRASWWLFWLICLDVDGINAGMRELGQRMCRSCALGWGGEEGWGEEEG